MSLAFALLGLVPCPDYGATYTLTDLGTLGGAQSSGGGINNVGQVTGWANTAKGAQHAFLYAPGPSAVMQDLGTLPGSDAPMCAASSSPPASQCSSFGAGINDAGQVTGTSVSNGGTQQAFLWLPGTGGTAPSMVPLPTLPGGTGSGGSAINSAGQVTITGWSSTSVSASDAVIWGPDPPWTVTDIGLLLCPASGCPSPPIGSAGYGINNAGVVVGQGFGDGQFAAGPGETGFGYSPGPPPTAAPSFIVPLPPTGDALYYYDPGIAYGVNGGGQATGWAASPILFGPVSVEAFLGVSGGSSGSQLPVSIGTLGSGNLGSVGYSVNATGQVTGAAGTFNENAMGFAQLAFTPQRAFLYSNGAMTDLNSLISPLAPNITLTKGDGINDNGWIVADGVNSQTGQTHAYLLTPSPGPPACPPNALCILQPSITALCNIPCALKSSVYWAPPVFVGDPWLNGVSFAMVAATEKQALALSAALRVEVNTEPRAQPVSKRTTRAELLDRGSSRLYRVLVVGPFVDVSAAPDAASVGSRGAELSLPYVATDKARSEVLRMVTFDKARDRWLEVKGQRLNAAKHLITARVPAGGRFTVVAQMRPEH